VGLGLVVGLDDGQCPGGEQGGLDDGGGGLLDDGEPVGSVDGLVVLELGADDEACV
jgi:hypothetical protein